MKVVTKLWATLPLTYRTQWYTFVTATHGISHFDLCLPAVSLATWWNFQTDDPKHAKYIPHDEKNLAWYYACDHLLRSLCSDLSLRCLSWLTYEWCFQWAKFSADVTSENRILCSKQPGHSFTIISCRSKRMVKVVKSYTDWDIPAPISLWVSY
jgi:hypothetical protein